MAPSPELCFEVLGAAHLDSESLTYLVVAGGTPESVLLALGADADHVIADVTDLDFENFTGYAAAEVNGGVIAIEHSGYGDPSAQALGLMSVGGRAAVARSNIQANERFGCARDGLVIFDSNEFAFVEREEKAMVPAELIDLFDAAWVDLNADSDGGRHEGGLAGVFTAMAMANVFTGVSVTAEDLQRAQSRGYYRTPMLSYLG